MVLPVRSSLLILFTLGLVPIAAALAPAPPSAAPHDPTPFSAHLADAIDARPLLVPGLTLDEATARTAAALGVAAPPLPDDLDPRLAASLAHLLSALVVAHNVREQVYAAVPDDALRAAIHDGHHAEALAGSLDAAPLRRAAATVAAAVDDQLPLLRALAHEAAHGGGLGAPLDLAPVLVVDPTGTDTLHLRDAVLVVDLGGDDEYRTNAGGSMIHVSLVGDPNSCAFHLFGNGIDCDNEDAFQSFTAALLVDVDGDDTYGHYQPPRIGSRDALCTGAPMVRRVATIGTGSGGLGMLYDLAGNDAYHGKTLTMGHGHIAGVGTFYDAAGDDTYHLIRSGLGSGILGGSGVFLDDDGHDTYTFTAPPGGLWNVDQARCDHSARLGLGAGVLGATGNFQDTRGDDTYRVDSQALGFGLTAATGIFADLDGTDDYGGYPGRGDDTMTPPGPGWFIDRSG